MSRHSRSLLAAALALAAAAALGHGDEDHGDAAKAAKRTPGQIATQEKAAAIVGDGESPQRLADGSVLLPKPTQRRLALRTTLAAIAEHARGIELNGRVVTDPNAGGRVQAA